MRRSISILLVLLVAIVAWVIVRPGGGDDLKTANPYTHYQRAAAARAPIFIMITSDT